MKKIILLCLFLISQAYGQTDFGLRDNSIGFSENKGQIRDQFNKVNTKVLYHLAVPNLNVQLRKSGFSYDFFEAEKKIVQKPELTDSFNRKDSINQLTNYQIHRLEFEFENINPDLKITTSDKCQGYDNFYNILHSSEICHVEKYREVIYKNIYRKIDLHFLVTDDINKPFEYNFVIHEGGRISDIKFKIKGARTKLIENAISVKLRFGEMREIIPKSWQKENVGNSVDIRYVSLGRNTYGFAAFCDSPADQIIIDPVPVRIWGSYFGGNAFPMNITSDSDDNLVITGTTTSSSNIATQGAFQTSMAGYPSAYIVKFNPDGQRLWGTYYPVIPKNIVTDSQMNIIFCGSTNSASLNISTPGSHQPVKSGGYDVVITKLDASGNRVWSTFYGGENGENCYSLDVDGSNNIFFGGETTSTQNIASPGSYKQTFSGGIDGFLVKLSPDGQRLWGTYFGGANPDGVMSTQTGDDGSVYIAGSTRSIDGIATAGSYQTTNNMNDGFIAKFDTSGNLQWGTYIGGEDYDDLLRGTLTGNNFYIQGKTFSHTNIATPSALVPNFPNSTYIYYLICFDVSSQQKTWGTYFTSQITDIKSDAGNVYFCGDTGASSGIATPDAYMPIKGPYSKSYLIKLDNTGQRVWGTYYGGEKGEQNCYVALGPAGSIFMHGMCNGSLTGIATENAFQTSIAPQTMTTYMVKFKDCTSTSSASSNSPVCDGGTIELHAEGGVSYSWTGPNGFSSTEQNPLIVNAVAVNSGNYTCNISGTGCDSAVQIAVGVGDDTPPVPSVGSLPDIVAECSINVTNIPSAFDICSGTISATTVDPLQYNAIGTYTLHWRYTDNSGNFAMQQQQIIVNPSPGFSVATEITSNQCNSNSVTFDLPKLIPQIIPQSTAAVTFYRSLPDALSQTDPIGSPNAYSVSSPSEVYALVESPSGCKAISTIHLAIIEMPAMQNAMLSQCVLNTGVFDLNTAQSLIDPTQTLTLRYYASPADFDADIEITNPSNFTFFGDTHTVFVKGINAAGCSAIASLQLHKSNVTVISLADDVKCANPNEVTIFTLDSHKAEILQLLPNDSYTFAYYESEQEALAGTGTSLNPDYILNGGYQEIFYRIYGSGGCPFIAKIRISTVSNPTLDLSDEYWLCKDGSVSLTLTDFDTYQWSTGEVTSAVTISHPGNYSVTVGKATGGVICYKTKNFKITQTETAEIKNITVEDFTDNNNSITVYPYSDNYEYSLDGITFQSDNTFVNLQNGNYTVYVRDLAHCGVDTRNVTLLMYPRYFSPNGDGKSDFWQIKNSYFSKNFTVQIYDRYGKALLSFNQHSQGWDGTFNGKPLPATDYWFTVKTADGKELKGHFSLLR